MKIKSMSIKEIKSELHEGIENINDNEFLLAIKELIERKYKPIEHIQLSKIQYDRIIESDKQIDEGDFFTNKEVDKIIDKWLEE